MPGLTDDVWVACAAGHLDGVPARLSDSPRQRGRVRLHDAGLRKDRFCRHSLSDHLPDSLLAHHLCDGALDDVVHMGGGDHQHAVDVAHDQVAICHRHGVARTRPGTGNPPRARAAAGPARRPPWRTRASPSPRISRVSRWWPPSTAPAAPRLLRPGAHQPAPERVAQRTAGRDVDLPGLQSGRARGTSGRTAPAGRNGRPARRCNRPRAPSWRARPRPCPAAARGWRGAGTAGSARRHPSRRRSRR